MPISLITCMMQISFLKDTHYTNSCKEIDILGGPISIKEIESLIDNISEKKTQSLSDITRRKMFFSCFKDFITSLINEVTSRC